MAVEPKEGLIDKIVSLAKRRGYIFQSSEIYGGINALYDFGPLGVQLKRNIKDLWWRHVVDLREDVVGIDTSIIMNPRVWEASGHVSGFSDPMVDCRKCKNRYRADHLEGPRCPNCGGELTEARQFNLMFKTFLGPVEDSSAQVYLRPETAQGMFVNFDNIVNSTRKRVPFGIAQQGKSFRNEISPGNFIFRSREFEQMEMEFFVEPGTDENWHQYWMKSRLDWYSSVLGIRAENLRLREHGADELAHYSKACSDVEIRFPFGWSELEGIANRTDFDLKAHMQHSGRDLSYFDDQKQERYVPYVIEPAAGVDRTALAVLCDAYDEEEVRGEVRVVLRLHPAVAPVQVAVLPLSRKEELSEVARPVSLELRNHFRVEYDDTQSIGRRYRRQDEIGTPFCVTVDFQTIEDRAVTIRHRDTMEQVRVPIAELEGHLRAAQAGWLAPVHSSSLLG
ncbi:MAG: glycine--tRNA ligase [Candidatus Dormibacteria bacterium]